MKIRVIASANPRGGRANFFDIDKRVIGGTSLFTRWQRMVARVGRKRRKANGCDSRLEHRPRRLTPDILRQGKPKVDKTAANVNERIEVPPHGVMPNACATLN